MKYVFFVLVYLWSFHSIFSQELIVDSGVVLKKGVYKTFEEFKYNSPSLDYSGSIESRSVSYGAFKSAGKITYYGIGKQLDGGIKTMSVFGFSDGKKVYLNLKGISNNTKNFVELEYLGRYCYYKFIDNDVGMGYMFGVVGVIASTSSGEVLIDINDGTYYDASKKNLKELFPHEDIEIDLKLVSNEKFKYLALTKKYSSLYSGEISRVGRIKEGNLEELLNRLPEDFTIEDYQNRALSYSNSSNINEIRVVSKFYKDGTPKTLGLWASHKMGNNSDYLYDVGTWHHYHKNGQLAEVINYNLVGEKNGAHIKYSETGEILEQHLYDNGELIPSLDSLE